MEYKEDREEQAGVHGPPSSAPGLAPLHSPQRPSASGAVSEVSYDAGETKSRTIAEAEQVSVGFHQGHSIPGAPLEATAAQWSQAPERRPPEGGGLQMAIEMPRPLLTTTGEERRSGARRDAETESESDCTTVRAELRSLKMELARIKSERAAEEEESTSGGPRGPAQKATHKVPPQKQPDLFDTACACFRTKRGDAAPSPAKKRAGGQGTAQAPEQEDHASTFIAGRPRGSSSSSREQTPSPEQRREEAASYDPNWSGVHGPAFTDIVGSFFDDLIGGADDDLRQASPSPAAVERPRE